MRTRWSDFFLGATVGIIGCVAILMMSRQACADDLDGPAIAVRVAEELRRHGFDRVTDSIPPLVEMEHRNGNAGETNALTISISAHEPEACRVRIVAHEACHIQLSRAYGAHSEIESVCRAIEEIIDPGYKPGCESR